MDKIRPGVKGGVKGGAPASTSPVNKVCYYCQEVGHTAKDCPTLAEMVAKAAAKAKAKPDGGRSGP